MVHLLQSLQCTCKTSTSGEEAVEFVRNDTTQLLDAIFMDIYMPGISGIEATKRIRTITGNILYVCKLIIFILQQNGKILH